MKWTDFGIIEYKHVYILIKAHKMSPLLVIFTRINANYSFCGSQNIYVS